MTKQTGKGNRLRRREDNQKLVMTLIPLLKLLLFSYLPMIGLLMAFEFYRADTMFLSKWVWFDNFVFIFKYSQIGRMLVNAVLLNLLFLFFGTVVSVILALFLFELTHFRRFVKVTQALYFLPFFVAWPLVGSLLLSMIGSNGILTFAIFRFSGTRVDFYSRPELWRAIMTIVYLWKFAGVSAITNYCVLLGCDREVYEAAEIDGAGRFQRMWFVSLSELKFMILIGVITSCGNIIRLDLPMMYFSTGDKAALYPTMEVMETYLYRALLKSARLGQPVAAGLFQGLVGLVMSVGANVVVRRIDRDAALF